MMRALWLHYPDDAHGGGARRSVSVGAANLLVAPVVEKGATSAHVYLPRGDWYDFWTGEQCRREAARSRARWTSRRCRFTCAPARSAHGSGEAVHRGGH